MKPPPAAEGSNFVISPLMLSLLFSLLLNIGKEKQEKEEKTEMKAKNTPDGEGVRKGGLCKGERGGDKKVRETGG